MSKLFPYRFYHGRTNPEDLDWDFLLKVQAEEEQIKRREQQEKERLEKERESAS